MKTTTVAGLVASAVLVCLLVAVAHAALSGLDHIEFGRVSR